MDLLLIGAACVVAVVGYVLLGGLATALVLNHLLTPGRYDWAGLRRPAPADPLAVCYRGDPSTIPGWEHSEVIYQTLLGPAPAWLLHPAGDAGATWAIFVHGVGGIRENGYRQASVMRDLGVPSLLITYRNDLGAPIDRGLHSFGLTEWRDLEAAVDHALAHGASRVVLMAESMGGAIVGQFLARSDRASRVAALVLDAPALDFPATIAGVLRRYGVLLAPMIVRLGLGVLRLWQSVDLERARCLDAVAAFEGPVFVAHGSGDRLVPVAISDRLLAAREGRPTVSLPTTADHLQSWRENADAYRTGVTEVVESIGAASRLAA